MKDTNHDSASTIKNDAEADKHSTEPEQKTPKDNIGKTTNKTLVGTPQQPPKSKLNGRILANQRIDRLRKTESKHKRNDETYNKEYKMEEEDAQTTYKMENNMVDGNVKSTQKIGKLQQIKKPKHPKYEDWNNQEQKEETLDTNPTTSTEPYQLRYIDDTVTVLPLTVQNQPIIGPMTEELHIRMTDDSKASYKGITDYNVYTTLPKPLNTIVTAMPVTVQNQHCTEPMPETTAQNRHAGRLLVEVRDARPPINSGMYGPIPSLSGPPAASTPQASDR